jgi:hypothetical protein
MVIARHKRQSLTDISYRLLLPRRTRSVLPHCGAEKRYQLWVLVCRRALGYSLGI